MARKELGCEWCPAVTVRLVYVIPVLKPIARFNGFFFA
jgi:hypothetical protein